MLIQIDSEVAGSDLITIGETEFSVKDINKGIAEVFNSRLYYHGEDSESNYLTYNKNLVLHRDIEYELYVNTKENMVCFIITNQLHPLSTEDNPLFYHFGVEITEKGLRSVFSTIAHGPREKGYMFYERDAVYHGSYVLRIDETNKPVHEKMSDEWIESRKAALGLYMEETREANMQDYAFKPGNYQIYVAGFNESDIDSVVIFEHESGLVYSGFCYFVHNSEPGLISLNKVELVKDLTSRYFVKYLERVKSNPALSMEYFFH
ncbi:MAG: hypothetical protein LBR85_02150 [Oscillospiraceae bacterium]|nr:hypothetical protein [Oscillospiraceae bacterium]